MKLKELLFWGLMIIIATFYITTGNEMHDKRAEEMKIKQKENNITRED